MRMQRLLTFFGIFLVFLLSACAGTQQTPAPPQQVTPAPAPQATVPAKPYYYTGNEGGGITRVDATTNTVTGTIQLEGAVHNVQISPDNLVLGATTTPKMEGHGSMAMNGFAAFYDATTNELIKKVEVGEHPAHIVFTHDGKFALVTNYGSNNVTVIDAKNYGVIQTIPTGKGPHGFRIAKDSKFAYIANMASDTVSVIDITAMKETRKITIGKSPVTTGVTNDGKVLLATLNAEDVVVIVDLTTDKVVKIPVGKGPAQVYIQSDDKFAFVANQGSEQTPSFTVSKIDMAAKKVVATIETGKGAHGIVTSPDNKFVYITNMYDNTVSIIDNMQNKVVGTVSVGNIPNGITYKP